MPDIGDIKKGTDVGFKSVNKYIWSACISCNRERWVKLRYGKPVSPRCHCCSCRRTFGGENNRLWKGGRFIDSGGYISIILRQDNFFYSMARKNG